MFFNIGVLKNFATVTGKHLCCSLFLIKLRTYACNFIKRRLQHRCCPVNIAKFFRTVFLQNYSGGYFFKSENMYCCNIQVSNLCCEIYLLLHLSILVFWVTYIARYFIICFFIFLLIIWIYVGLVLCCALLRSIEDYSVLAYLCVWLKFSSMVQWSQRQMTFVFPCLSSASSLKEK